MGLGAPGKEESLSLFVVQAFAKRRLCAMKRVSKLTVSISIIIGLFTLQASAIEPTPSQSELQSKTSFFVVEYLEIREAPYSPKISLASSSGEAQFQPKKVTEFHEYPHEYIENLNKKIHSGISSQAIDITETKTVDFGVIKVSLYFNKMSSYQGIDRYRVFNSFEWIRLPSPGYVTNIQGVIGLAFGDQLSIDGDNVNGQITYSRYVSPGSGGGSNLTYNLDFETVNVPDSLFARAAKFQFTHQRGQGLSDYLTALKGTMSCVVLKTNTNNTSCSVLASYEDVDLFGLISDSVSFSFSDGFSFAFGAVHHPYNIQDSLILV